MLKNCSTSSDLDDRIENLKSIIPIDSNPNLGRIVGEAVNRTDIGVPDSTPYVLINGGMSPGWQKPYAAVVRYAKRWFLPRTVLSFCHPVSSRGSGNCCD